jgi:hypothetical protein
MNDAHWLCKLLVDGVLKKSFITPQAQQELRDLTHQRYMQALPCYQNQMLKIVYKVLKNGYAYQKRTISDFYALQRSQRGLGDKT